MAIPGFDDEKPSPDPSRSQTGTHEPDIKGKSRATEDEGSELDEDTCAICLSDVWNKAEAAPCHHNAFCFACIHTWCAMSRRCPLCNTEVEFLMTHVRSETDFQKHHLLPLSTIDTRNPADPPLFPAAADIDMAARRQLFRHPRRKYEWGRRNKRVELEKLEEEQLALQRRKWIYKHKLFAKHVATNAYTRYQSFTPSQFASSGDRKSRVVTFARRELQVFPSVDVEWLVTYLLQIMCQLDLRSDNAIRLLAEFLGFDQAEHFAHEVQTFARSPFADLKNWDHFTQYDRPICREPSPALPAPAKLAVRPPSPDFHLEHGHKRRRPSGGYMDRYADSYVPDYSHRKAHRRENRSPPRPPRPRRNRSPPRDRLERQTRGINENGNETGGLSQDFRQSSRRVHRGRSLSPPIRERRSSSPARPNEIQRYGHGEPYQVVAMIDENEHLPSDHFETPPLPDRPSGDASTEDMAYRGFDEHSARRDSLQARLEAEKAEAAQRKIEEAERRKVALAEKLKKEKEEQAKKAARDAFKRKLMARLEEEKSRAAREAKQTSGQNAAFVEGAMSPDDDWGGEPDDHKQYRHFDRENELRRALDARQASGMTRFDPKARLLAQMTDMEARLHALKHQMGM